MNRYYLAPLEGITTHIFRNAYHRHFAPMDKYFTPFLVPHSKKGFSAKEKREILPENNEGLCLIPQIMSNHAGDCLKTIGKLQAYGYREINLNMGCPSKTVVSKGRGSGFLAFPQELDRFLDKVFEGAGNMDVRISIKTRLGKEEPEEFYRILEIYNRYPVEELIVHPRVQRDFYKNVPDLGMFAYAQENSESMLCYNGDIFTVERYEEIRKKLSGVKAFMIGRGLLMDPFLLERIKKTGEEQVRAAKLRSFHDQLYADYRALDMGDKNVLFKMKELWCYLGHSFPENHKALKKIRKAERLDRYEEAVEELL